MRSKMIVKGKLGTYECKVVSCGWTFAEVKVRKMVERSFFGIFKWQGKKTVAVSDGAHPRFMYNVERATPSALRSWYKEVVDQYERIEEAWNKELED